MTVGTRQRQAGTEQRAGQRVSNRRDARKAADSACSALWSTAVRCQEKTMGGEVQNTLAGRESLHGCLGGIRANEHTSLRRLARRCRRSCRCRRAIAPDARDLVDLKPGCGKGTELRASDDDAPRRIPSCGKDFTTVCRCTNGKKTSGPRKVRASNHQISFRGEVLNCRTPLDQETAIGGWQAREADKI